MCCHGIHSDYTVFFWNFVRNGRASFGTTGPDAFQNKKAPVAGSIILAGLLLKLGGYGVIRLRGLFILSVVMYGLAWASRK